MSRAPKKRLIVCCDGTWQAGDKTYGTNLSNVAKLSRMINRESEPDHIPQVVYYQSGVGTTGVLDTAVQGFVGSGLSDNVASAYHYLSTNFCKEGSDYANDEIFLFGFSRGAYTARALGGLITDLGLLEPQFLNDFPRAFEIYKSLGKKARDLEKNKFLGKKARDLEKSKSLSKEAAEQNSSDQTVLDSSSLGTEDRYFWEELRWKRYPGVKIKVIGVWDTVGALGIPESLISKVFPWINARHQFFNTTLSPNIENAFQALALDEHRGSFPPALWYLPEKVEAHQKMPNLKQCWFPGYHGSIGGGGGKLQHSLQYWSPPLASWLLPDKSQMHEVTLAWMCDQINGLLTFDKIAVDYILKSKAINPKNWAICPESDMAKSLPVFNLHVLGGSHPRTPGRYHEGWKTNESIHPSVQYRREKSFLHYSPKPLGERAVQFYQRGVPRWNVRQPVQHMAKRFQELAKHLWEFVSHLLNPPDSPSTARPQVGPASTQKASKAKAAVANPSVSSTSPRPSIKDELFSIIVDGFICALLLLPVWSSSSVLWQWEETSNDPSSQYSASWVREGVKRTKKEFKEEDQTIPEWVIRRSEDRHKINFETDILPPQFKKHLENRNEKCVTALKNLKAETPFWTRTDWKLGEPPGPPIQQLGESPQTPIRQPGPPAQTPSQQTDYGAKQEESHRLRHHRTTEKKHKKGWMEQDENDLHDLYNGGAVQHI